MGYEAGKERQGNYAIAIGYQAGYTRGIPSNNTIEGNYAIAIGYQAGYQTQHEKSIILNASGSALNSQGTSRFHVKPIRSDTNSNKLLYNSTTGEITYQPDSGGGGTTITGSGFKSNHSGTNVNSTGSISIGSYAGNSGQGSYAIAIGNEAGKQEAGDYSINIGYSTQTGYIDNTSTGFPESNGSTWKNSIAIGKEAHAWNKHQIIITSSDNMDNRNGPCESDSDVGVIMINAHPTWGLKDNNNLGGCYIRPIRHDNKIIYYIIMEVPAK